MSHRTNGTRRTIGQRPVASIQDVADRAEVSIATVSRALNKPHLVSPETALRISRAVTELGYRPNRLAQALMTRRSGVVGIALPDIHGEFYSDLMRGADAEAREQGCHLLVGSSHLAPLDGTDPATGGMGRALGLIDGLAVMITEPRPTLDAELEALGAPIVVVDAEVADHDAVVVNHAGGAREATRHLLDGTPPSKCFFVGGPESNLDSRARARAFGATLCEAGHSPTPDQIRFDSYSIGWGQRWTRDAARIQDLRGIAVFAANDEIGYGVVTQAQDLGFGVPDDVRVVGFDGTRLTEIARPSLSTVLVPREELGRQAIRVLLQRLESPDAPRRRVMLSTSLIVRGSSGQ
ncbi:MAG: LacI family DNA-binding transcriptional regulator [Phycisphaeraceae bacterium]|nr:LacI family DNA-binding transcriptional regulator [Phycisphaeraceae bacterium]